MLTQKPFLLHGVLWKYPIAWASPGLAREPVALGADYQWLRVALSQGSFGKA